MVDNRPSLSVIIVARNCGPVLSKCLEKIVCQHYPKEKMEIIVVDGGSTDDTPIVAVRYGAKIVAGGYPDNPEARRYGGAVCAQHEILVFIDADNILPDAEWLNQMVQPFQEDAETIAAFTRWYGYRPDTPPIDQYYALMGGNDPVVFYLGKNDRVPYHRHGLPTGALLKIRKKNYDIVAFDIDSLPVIGCNGFLIRRKILRQLSFPDPQAYFHIDVNVDIIRQLGRNRFAVVNTHLIHLTGDTLKRSIRKRIEYMRLHHMRLSGLRRYKVFDVTKPTDVVRLSLMIFFACTVVEPVFRALIGFLKTKNRYWWYHPVISFLFVVGYASGIWIKGKGR